MEQFNEKGKVGTTTYVIHFELGWYCVYIGGIRRTAKKSLRGAYGVLRKIDPNFASDSTIRVRANQAAVSEALRSNKCPQCGGGVHRNLALTGWVQCDGFGTEGFRKNPSAVPCSWQGFTA
jgi:hypothetical protein